MSEGSGGFTREQVRAAIWAVADLMEIPFEEWPPIKEFRKSAEPPEPPPEEQRP
jgi:hypothetical protein